MYSICLIRTCRLCNKPIVCLLQVCPFASAHFDSGRWLAKNPSPPRRASGEDGKTDSVFGEEMRLIDSKSPPLLEKH
jgi:hypothetical protein